ncbi:unnamed protein product [Clavelina lepadiformis]|uniref:Uncharacterized protein n=1 Tax=Clavelina lepadiformis TaxID=159417 RepID=A0ABP0GMZ7_CLALP
MTTEEDIQGITTDASLLSAKKHAPAEKPKLGRKQSVFVGTIVEVRDKRGTLGSAIPTVPLAYAWICLFCNVFAPGTGTFLMALAALCGAKTNSKKPSRCKDFLLNLVAFLLQLLTALLIVGWIWSIFWGMNVVTQANEVKTIEQAKKGKRIKTDKPICKNNES